MRRVLGITDFMYEQVFAPFTNEECYSILPVILKPKSVGFLTLRSSDPFDHPIIEPRYFSNPHDLNTMAAALKLAFQLATSEPFRSKYNAKPAGAVVPGKL